MQPPVSLRRRGDLDAPCEIARGDGRDVILQAFHWNLVKTQGTGTMDGRGVSWYRVLGEMVDRIAAVGFTVVYLPPPWRDDSAWSAGGRHGGGEGYFWHDFDLDSRYGTKPELTALIGALHARGLKVIVDLVPNHRDATRMQRDVWPYPGECWALGGVDTGGRFLDGEFDLALGHPTVQARFRAALDELMEDCGVDGWRWDFVWGYGVDEVTRFIRETREIEYLSIGEYWQGDPGLASDPMIARYGADERARIVGWAKDARSLAFDVRLKAQLQTGVAANLRGGLCASRRREDRELVVTYVDNHDTGASPHSPANGWGQRHWPCPDGFKSSAYAFILTMPGTPCVYWPDCFDWGFEARISSLVAARRAAGITSGSSWEDAGREHGGFAAIVHDARGAPSLAVSIRSTFDPGAAWELAAADDGEWRVWRARGAVAER